MTVIESAILGWGARTASASSVATIGIAVITSCPKRRGSPKTRVRPVPKATRACTSKGKANASTPTIQANFRFGVSTGLGYLRTAPVAHGLCAGDVGALTAQAVPAEDEHVAQPRGGRAMPALALRLPAHTAVGDRRQGIYGPHFVAAPIPRLVLLYTSYRLVPQFVVHHLRSGSRLASFVRRVKCRRQERVACQCGRRPPGACLRLRASRCRG